MPDMIPERAIGPDTSRLLAYVSELELEVDRLWRHGTFLVREVTVTLTRILRLCTASTSSPPLPTLGEVQSITRALLDVVKDLYDLPGYHPEHDQVVAIAVRPLALQVFRWQLRLTGTQGVDLRLELDADHVDWFPARLRPILDNLLSHALRHRDPVATPGWVAIGLQTSDDGYELRLSDNSNWTTTCDAGRNLALFSRTPIYKDGFGAGLAGWCGCWSSKAAGASSSAHVRSQGPSSS